MTGKRIGLVIGNNYPDSKQELRFAVADALSMKEVLLNKDICGFDEVSKQHISYIKFKFLIVE